METLDVDRCSVLELSEDGTSHRITHGYARPGIRPPEFGIELATALPWYTEQVRRGQRIVLPRLPEGLPQEARAELAYVASTGMKSHVILPLVVDREIVGSLGIGTFCRHREFPPEFLSRLELVASVFASALYRRRAETRLIEAQDLNRAVLASVASEIVVLDREGRIIAVNRAWETSARRERVPLSDVRPGADYFEILAQVFGEGVSEAATARAAGIRSVLSGEKDKFEIAYAYPHSTGMLSYLLCATRLTGAAGGAVVVHTDVTDAGAGEAGPGEGAAAGERAQGAPAGRERGPAAGDPAGRASSRRSWAGARRSPCCWNRCGRWPKRTRRCSCSARPGPARTSWRAPSTTAATAGAGRSSP